MKSVKGIFITMLLGLILLPTGIFLQKNSADQMPYHKYFSESDICLNKDKYEDGKPIKIKGEANFSQEIPFSVKTDSGYMFKDKYLNYQLNVKHVKKTESEKNSKIYYRWEKVLTKTSPETATVSIGGINIPLIQFTKILTPTSKYIVKYNPASKSFSEYDANSIKKPEKNDFDNKAILYELKGNVFDNNFKEYIVYGIYDKSSNTLSPVKHSRGGDKLLLLSAYNDSITFEKLENASSGESKMTFILGLLCFTFGFSLFFSPILKMIKSIPILGGAASGIIYISLFIISLILSLLFYFFFKFFWALLIITISIIVMSIFIKKKVA